MYLKSLVLKGFKSFADRSVMPFEPGITAIVGPNGSGKSNICDAVLWVLGERSARSLRGQTMEDVIFSGSAARKPVSVAEVSLVLDNSCGTLPVDCEEVSLTRRMYRSGESEYLINGSPARRLDFMDILHDSGLGAGTHSIISQGHLSSILQSRPEDRRLLIEEAAGVLKHKQRRERSERKLELMDRSVQRVGDIVKEVKRQIKPLERKAKRALAYRDASSELARLELELAVDDLRILQDAWNRTLAEEKGANAAAEELRRRIENGERAESELQGRFRKSSSEAKCAAERYRRAQAAADKLGSTVLLFREKQRSAQSYLEEMRVSLENDLQAASAARVRREGASEELAQARERSDAAADALQRARRRADEAQAQQRGLQQEIDGLSQKRSSALSDLEEARASLAHAREELDAKRAEASLLQSRLEDADRRLDEASAAARSAEDALAAAQRDTDEAKEREDAAARETQRALELRDAARSAFDAARDERAAASARVQGFEELQRAERAANPLLDRLLSENDGNGDGPSPLVARISAPESLEGCLDQLLGRDIDLLFVRDGSRARSLAERFALMDENGSVSLLSLEAGPGSSRVAGEGTRLVDRLECDPECEPALERLLGDVWVFPDFRSAADFSDRHPGCRCVSEDGYIIRENGVIAYRRRAEGDRAALAGYRNLKRARADFEEAQSSLNAARLRAEECEKVLAAAQAAGLDASRDAARLKGVADAARVQAARTRKEVGVLRESRAGLQRRIDAVEAASAEAEQDLAGLQARVGSLAQTVDVYKDRLEAKRVELSPLRSLADAAAVELSEAKLEDATCSERLAWAERVLGDCEREIRKADGQASRAREGMARKRTAAGRVEPLLASLTALCDAAGSCIERLEGGVRESRLRSEGIGEAMEESRLATRHAREDYDVQAGRLADIRIEKSRIEVQVEVAMRTITQDCETPIETALALPELENRDETAARADGLRRRIAGMGDANPGAVEEYEQLKQRYDYLDAQYRDMVAARSALNGIIRAIDGRMRKDFTETFESVDANFREVFAELFPGGRASLTLVDPEDPDSGVEVNAQPPGKRILKMSLMSGGEKSLTALALLFAVYRTRSTPFYILDEVEAALDDTNLRRLVGYLGAMRDSSQFVIITHQRRTMETADVLYGVSMNDDGVTKVMSQRLDRALRHSKG